MGIMILYLEPYGNVSTIIALIRTYLIRRGIINFDLSLDHFHMTLDAGRRNYGVLLDLELYELSRIRHG